MTDIGLHCLSYGFVDTNPMSGHTRFHKVFARRLPHGEEVLSYVITVTRESFHVEQGIPIVEPRYFSEVTLEKDGKTFHLEYDYTWSVPEVEAHIIELLNHGLAERLHRTNGGTVAES